MLRVVNRLARSITPTWSIGGERVGGVLVNAAHEVEVACGTKSKDYFTMTSSKWHDPFRLAGEGWAGVKQLTKFFFRNIKLNQHSVWCVRHDQSFPDYWLAMYDPTVNMT